MKDRNTMNQRLKSQIRSKCRQMDIPLVGFAPAARWDDPPFEPWVPEAFRPAAIFPEARSVIVIGLPVPLPILETAPSIWYHELYRTVNILLDGYGYRIATWLSEQGFPSVWVPRDGYGSIGIVKESPVVFFSHRHAAYLAGLGTFGLNNVLLTPKYGPRVRFTSIFTAADLPADPVLEEDLCTRCMCCARICPVQALPGEDYPGGRTDTRACAIRSEELAARHISPCGFCIKVCPVGEDRKVFSREDRKIYNEDDPRYDSLHRAWTHVRSHGGGH